MVKCTRSCSLRKLYSDLETLSNLAYFSFIKIVTCIISIPDDETIISLFLAKANTPYMPIIQKKKTIV